MGYDLYFGAIQGVEPSDQVAEFVLHWYHATKYRLSKVLQKAYHVNEVVLGKPFSGFLETQLFFDNLIYTGCNFPKLSELKKERKHFMPYSISRRGRMYAQLSILIVVLIHLMVPDCTFAKFSDLNDCLLHHFKTAPDEITLGQIREECINIIAIKDTAEMAEVEDEGPVEKRLSVDQKNVLQPFTIMAHRQNYLLFGVHNFMVTAQRSSGKHMVTGKLTLKIQKHSFSSASKPPWPLISLIRA